eukprot:500494_1
MATSFTLFYLSSVFVRRIGALTYDCNTEECNKLFIFPGALPPNESVTMNCRNAGDCDKLTIYSASTLLIVNCLGVNSCNGTNVYCGAFDPPGALYSLSDMDRSGVYCQMHCDANPAPGCIDSLLSCKGDGIKSCSIRSYPDPTRDPIPNIDFSTLECDINAPNSCYMDCEESLCPNSKLLCHNPIGSAGCKCFGGYCSGVTESYDVTYHPTIRPTEMPTRETLHPTVTSGTINPTHAVISTTVTTVTVAVSERTTRDPTLVATDKSTRRPSTVNEREVIESTESDGTDHVSNGNAISLQNSIGYWWFICIGIGFVIVIIVIVIVFRAKKRFAVETHGRALGESVDIAISDAPEAVTSGNQTQKGSELLMTEVKQSKVQTDDSGVDGSDSGEHEDLYVESQVQCVTTRGDTTQGNVVHDEGGGDSDGNDDDTDALYVKPEKAA